MAENTFKVKLVSKDKQVIFAVTPSSLSESRSANYDQWNLVHLPTDLYAYRNTTSRNWEIQAPLVSRNIQEASVNSKILNTIRFWLLPDFGQTGAPPPIIKFSAYGDPNIKAVTCILRNYSWNYPTDVDYVFPTGDGASLEHKMPVIGTLGISLVEIYSASEIQKRTWKINISASDSKKPAGGDGPLGQVPPGFDNLKDAMGDIPDIPSIPNVSGDLTNYLTETTVPFITDIAKDVTSNLPSIPTPSIPNGFGNGELPFDPGNIFGNLA